MSTGLVVVVRMPFDRPSVRRVVEPGAMSIGRPSLAGAIVRGRNRHVRSLWPAPPPRSVRPRTHSLGVPLPTCALIEGAVRLIGRAGIRYHSGRCISGVQLFGRRCASGPPCGRRAAKVAPHPSFTRIAVHRRGPDQFVPRRSSAGLDQNAVVERAYVDQPVPAHCFRSRSALCAKAEGFRTAVRMR